MGWGGVWTGGENNIRGRQHRHDARCRAVGGGEGRGGGDNNVRGRLHHHDAGHVVDGACYVAIGFQSHAKAKNSQGHSKVNEGAVQIRSRICFAL